MVLLENITEEDKFEIGDILMRIMEDKTSVFDKIKILLLKVKIKKG